MNPILTTSNAAQASPRATDTKQTPDTVTDRAEAEDADAFATVFHAEDQRAEPEKAQVRLGTAVDSTPEDAQDTVKPVVASDTDAELPAADAEQTAPKFVATDRAEPTDRAALDQPDIQKLLPADITRNTDGRPEASVQNPVPSSPSLPKAADDATELVPGNSTAREQTAKAAQTNPPQIPATQSVSGREVEAMVQQPAVQRPLAPDRRVRAADIRLQESAPPATADRQNPVLTPLTALNASTTSGQAQTTTNPSAPNGRFAERALPERVGPTPQNGAYDSAAPTTANAAKTSVAQSVLFASMESAAAMGQDMPARLQGETTEIVQWDVRAGQPSGANATTALITQRADVPPHVAQQLATAMQRSPDKSVEIALNPPELGRVRMVMNASEAGVAVQVLTERTDTLDLMRRNIDELGRALSDLGYEDISFSFGQGDGREAEAETDDRTAGMIQLDAEDISPTASLITPNIPSLAIAPDSIDIRL
ncbi:MAG: flagellar hook-length control protein FliK [Pseudomonadota bacterium]